MDRYTVNTAKSQIGFIDVIVQPTFEVLKSFLPGLADYVGNFEKNKAVLSEKIEFYNQNLSIFKKILKNSLLFIVEILNEERERKKSKEKLDV